MCVYGRHKQRTVYDINNNLRYYQRLMKGLRDAISQGTLEQFVDAFYKRIGKEKPALID